jgi:hypothetical protein
MQATIHPPLFGAPTNRELRECASCGARFVGWHWHSRCRDCYRRPGANADQAQPAPAAELQRLRAELETAYLEVARQRRAHRDAAAKAAELERACASLKTDCDKWKRRYYAVLARKSGRAPIPPDILRRLLWLCHPDRHANSDAATVTTAWLLAQRSHG